MMQLIRRTEEQLMLEYHPADEMRCPMHFCIGQESVPAILSQFVRPNDVMMSHYRSHGYYLSKGASLPKMVAEFYGRATGANGGLAGSMELGSAEQNFSSGAIVGGSMLIPLGAAFAQKYRSEDNISISIMGDGSFDEGVTYESMNLAALYHLPLLIVCENNKYAANTEVSKRLGGIELHTKAEAMGVPAALVDGYNLRSLAEILHKLVGEVRTGGGARFLEVTTYRFCAHVGPQPDDYLGYRAIEEIAEWRAKDPLPRLRAELLTGHSTEAQLDEIDKRIESEIEDAIAAAKTAPFPSLEWALDANLANTYAPNADKYFREIDSIFAGGQLETKLEPF